jgi:cytochrome c oxidase assembly protein subunit 15
MHVDMHCIKTTINPNKYFNRLVQLTCLLAVVVIVLGAYTRLSNAGLGCPDWPGCYGFLSVPHAEQVPPELGVLEVGKAWKEMIHRYFAGSLGLLILIVFILSIWLKLARSTITLSTLLLLLVLFQATLGMLTVTMSLQPLIVVGHLLGGFLVLNLIWLLLLNINSAPENSGPITNKITKNTYTTAIASSSNLTFITSLLLIFLVLSQIALGGWLSANYAASFCNELPFCDGFNSHSSWQQFSFLSIWQLPTSSNYEFGVLPADARLSIHLFHRFWAIITCLMVLTFIIRVYLCSVELHIKNCILWVASLMVSQILLGVMMVFWNFPILMALAHNLCAALLLMSLIRLSYGLSKSSNTNCQEQRGG